MKILQGNRKRVLVSLMLIFTIMISLVGFQSNTYAATRNGVVTKQYVNVRNAAGTSNTQVLCVVNPGQPIEIIDETRVSGDIWYKVNLTLDGKAYTGWIFGEYVDVYAQADEDYVKTLTNAGFPASYATQLAQLHIKYPNWTFEAVLTGIDWNEAVKQESVIGRNLIHNSYDDSRKSTESGAYNWNTNTWAAYDGTSWVAANSKYIAYCMDPRNFINDTNIFMFESLSYNSTQNLDGIKAIINDTFMKNDVSDTNGTLNYANTFLEIGKQLGISPYHLASRVRQEQGTSGTSQLISGTVKGYEGYYNYFNVGAYSTAAGSITENGLKKAKEKGWNSRYKSIYGGAELLAKNYISVGQDTLYFQKFNVVNKNALYTHQYMTNVMAVISESQSAAKGYSNKSQAFHFRIPVYTNMPESAVTFQDTGNPNQYLKSLSVSGLPLTPGFSGSRTNYSIVVGSGTTSVTISASAVASTSRVSGTGTFQLNTGDNTFVVTCKAQNGDERKYTIIVSRKTTESEDGNNNINYNVTSSTYQVGEQITGVQPGTTGSDFIGKFKTSGCSVKVLKADGTENTGYIGTGSQLAVYSGNNLLKTYNIVVYGDVNGDGKLSMADLVKINRHLLGIETLRGVYYQAGDTNRKNDGISMSDLVITNRTLLGLTSIKQ